MHVSKYIFYLILGINVLNAHLIRDGRCFCNEMPTTYLTRKQIEKDASFCEIMHMDQAIDLTYCDTLKKSRIVLGWAVLKNHLPAIMEDTFDSYEQEGFGIKLKNNGISYYSTHGFGADYSYEKNPLEMHVSFSDKKMVVRPNLPFRAFEQMAVDGITYPEIKASCRLNDSGVLMPQLEFDYGRIQVTMQAVEDTALTFNLSNCYKGRIDAKTGLAYWSELFEE